jgi:hypothetical protein
MGTMKIGTMASGSIQNRTEVVVDFVNAAALGLATTQA